MNPTRLSAFTADIPVIEKHGSADPDITDLVYDSRQVTPGALFFALPGLHADGSAFITQAIAKGAAAVIHETPLASYDPAVALPSRRERALRDVPGLGRLLRQPLEGPRRHRRHGHRGKEHDGLPHLSAAPPRGKARGLYLHRRLLRLGRGTPEPRASDHARGGHNPQETRPHARQRPRVRRRRVLVPRAFRSRRTGSATCSSTSGS